MVVVTGVATGAAATGTAGASVVTVRSEATPVTPLRGANTVKVAARPMTPAIIKMRPMVWIFTPVAVLCTANNRIAPTAMRKTEKPIRMWTLRSMAATQPCNSQLPDASASETPRIGLRPKTCRVGATGFEPVTARV